MNLSVDTYCSKASHKSSVFVDFDVDVNTDA